MTMSRMAIRPPGRSAPKPCEQFAVVLPGMLVADRADPGEIGPAGQFVGVEIAGHERHPLGELRAGQPLPGPARWRRAGRRSWPWRGTARRKASVHVPEAPPTSSKWRNCGGPSRATRSSAIGPETECMAAMKAARSASAPRMLAGRGSACPP